MQKVATVRLHGWIGLSAALMLPFGLFFLVPAFALRGEVIAPGVSIEDIQVGGMTEEEASRLVDERCKDIAVKINATGMVREGVSLPGRSWDLQIGQCGGAADTATAVSQALNVGRAGYIWDNSAEILRTWKNPTTIRLAFVFDSHQLRLALRRIATEVDVVPVDASLKRVENRLVSTPEREGLRLNVEETAAAIARSFAYDHRELEALVEQIPPRVRLADIEGISTPLVTFSTWYSTGQRNRSNNIRLCSDRIDGTLLLPGETFSFNRRVGDRTMKLGFKLAPIFVNKKKTIGVGGGVCQVSTTVYNAARNAGLKILERHPHSLPVAYVPEGRDATVAYPYNDMKFQNTSGTPLFIEASPRGGRLFVRLWGRADAGISRSTVNARVRKIPHPKPPSPKPAPKKPLEPPPTPVVMPASDTQTN